ncbi:hypothetical protein [Bacillus sp. 165]|uniref:hypothetical protein n=1 Tax=Bacillus sp. 165 TaxID=1529117 RepID=UPI001ADBA956|nr:hypothetical protein [Bacillus sp. 165]MBO9130647.1 hypothetical protein [Bacillus sp. 165]
MMPFLYFPENKLEYIPAGITCLLFIIGAFLTWRAFMRASKRELKQFQEMEQRIDQINGTAESNSNLLK